MNEEYSYIFYTFFENLQEMKEKPPWCLFEIYHMYGNGIISISFMNRFFFFFRNLGLLEVFISKIMC